MKVVYIRLLSKLVAKITIECYTMLGIVADNIILHAYVGI